MSASLRNNARRRSTITPRKLPRQARARETVAAILQAATYILQKSGYEAMTTNQVAERAGVNIASLYQYFPNKQAILGELARRHVGKARGMLADKLAQLRANPKMSIRDRVRAMVDVTCAEHVGDPRLHEIFSALVKHLHAYMVSKITHARRYVKTYGGLFVRSVFRITGTRVISVTSCMYSPPSSLNLK